MKLELELYSIEEVAKLFGVSKPTIYDWMNRRGLQWIRVGGRRRITRAAIEAFMAAGSDQRGDSEYNPSNIRTPMTVAGLLT